MITIAELRVLYAAWQAETHVPGSACTDAFEALDDVIFESLPLLLGELDTYRDALREIADLPEPLSNKNSALTQCAYLKEKASLVLGATA